MDKSGKVTLDCIADLKDVYTCAVYQEKLFSKHTESTKNMVIVQLKDNKFFNGRDLRNYAQGNLRNMNIWDETYLIYQTYGSG